jgi:hypothetical protein
MTEPRNAARSLFMAEGISPQEESQFKSGPETATKRYRVVLNCRSDKKDITRHEEATVGYQAD